MQMETITAKLGSGNDESKSIAKLMLKLFKEKAKAA